MNFYLNKYLALFLFKYSNKIEKIQKRFLAIVLNNNKSDYKVLLEKLYINNMNMIKMKSLAIQIFKNIINLITSCMKDLYQKQIIGYDQTILFLKTLKMEWFLPVF